MNNGLKVVSILHNDEISPRVFVLKFKREFSFIAGQVNLITLQTAEQPRM